MVTGLRLGLVSNTMVVAFDVDYCASDGLSYHSIALSSFIAFVLDKNSHKRTFGSGLIFLQGMIQ